MRGSEAGVAAYFSMLIFQFTPLHERQHDYYTQWNKWQTISIHASTWEAAREERKTWYEKHISIHASTWEAAERWQTSSKKYLNFNSRLYMRGSPFPYLPLYLCNVISIHASTWEAALPSIRSIPPRLFQFTPLHERQLQKYTIFSIKSTQFSTKPCFFIVTSRKVVFFSIPVQYFL